jgi:hypothetical protein
VAKASTAPDGTSDLSVARRRRVAATTAVIAAGFVVAVAALGSVARPEASPEIGPAPGRLKSVVAVAEQWLRDSAQTGGGD